MVEKRFKTKKVVHVSASYTFAQINFKQNGTFSQSRVKDFQLQFKYDKVKLNY